MNSPVSYFIHYAGPHWRADGMSFRMRFSDRFAITRLQAHLIREWRRDGCVMAEGWEGRTFVLDIRP